MIHRTLLIGLGKIGMGYDIGTYARDAVFSHARAVSIHKDFELVAAVESDQEKRNLFTSTYKRPAYSTLIEALRNIEVEVAIVTTPSATHYSVIQQLLEISPPKLLLCEKPLALRHQEGSDIVAMCEKRGVQLVVNYMRRSEPGAMKVGEWLSESRICPPVVGVVWYSGGFFNNGSHFFNLARSWLGRKLSGKPLSVPIFRTDGDIELDVEIEFEKGRLMFLRSPIENASHHSIEMLASNGRLKYDFNGEVIEWYPLMQGDSLSGSRSLSRTAQTIRSELSFYQLHVLNQVSRSLAGRHAALCDGYDALETLSDMHSILED